MTQCTVTGSADGNLTIVNNWLRSADFAGEKAMEEVACPLARLFWTGYVPHLENREILQE